MLPLSSVRTILLLSSSDILFRHIFPVCGYPKQRQILACNIPQGTGPQPPGHELRFSDGRYFTGLVGNLLLI